MMNWVGITPNKFHDWQFRYGKVNEHNTWLPRDFWLTDAEILQIISVTGQLRKRDARGYTNYKGEELYKAVAKALTK